MKIGVIGTGHVGLVTCASLAKVGHEVVGVDVDAEKIAMLRDGRSWFYEPGLDEMLAELLDGGSLSFSTQSEDAVAEADVAFICVGTPPRATGEANLVAVEQSAIDVARKSTKQTVVVEKSTVPAGTAQRLRRTLKQVRSSSLPELEIASNPEFLREGKAIEDSMHPERILVGADSEWAFEKMREVYAPWVAQGYPLVETNIATAELAKHACNAFLSLKISFANALARMCERAGADVVDVVDVMGSDSRIGRAFLNAGLGYGGYCFPKDIQAFERLASGLGYDFPLLREVERINEEALDAAVEKVVDALWNLEDKRVALFGLAFKPETDDSRFAPALGVARRLLDRGADVVAYDPVVRDEAAAEVPGLRLAPDLYAAADGADCVVVCTEWQEFKDVDLAKLRSVMSRPIIVDGRNVFDPESVGAAGFAYYPMGRRAIV
ncbi:MAG TPA: UDP-glucose/GDP-mannose dehydrogenase family protein [Actinomycetota bacterium]|nr:UDP-glucose/GDP-mannose dehydrogenase family protein [Actinomycetota bacterium]